MDKYKDLEDDELEKDPSDNLDVEDLSDLAPKDDSSDQESDSEEDPEAEVQDNENSANELNKEANSVLSEIPQAPQAHPSLNRFQDYLKQYKALQQQQNKGELVNGLLAAGGKIGQSIAGKYSGNFVPDQTGNKMLEEMNKQPLQQFEKGMAVQKAGMGLNAEAAAMDPDSPQSKLVRDYVEKRLGLKLAPDVSAADAQMLLKTVGRPTQTKFQKVNGTVTDPDTGVEKRISAIFDPSTGSYKDSTTGQALPGFLAEGLNPFQVVKGEHGEQELFNKSRGRAPAPIKPEANFDQAQGPQDVYSMLKPDTRKELNDKIVPNFNKLTEKTQQRMMHQAPIMAKLEEAQLNPAAYAQLQAEMARFDVGDQRLAQQEFNMFATRHGYKGWGDWVQKNSTGTISPDFAQDFAHTINNTVRGMQADLNKQAEQQAGLLISRLPPGSKVDAKHVAPLIYSGYKPMKPNAQAPGNGEIERKTKDGRIAVFDKNKKFLRYKDEKPEAAAMPSEEPDESQDEE